MRALECGLDLTLPPANTLLQASLCVNSTVRLDADVCNAVMALTEPKATIAEIRPQISHRIWDRFIERTFFSKDLGGRIFWKDFCTECFARILEWIFW